METLSKDQLCTLIDKLVIQSLDLMEDEVNLKRNIEKCTKEGEIDLAKTRYTKGSNSVSVLQLPTEDSKEFKALMTVDESVDDLGHPKLDVNSQVVDKETLHVDPIKWFGVLVPTSLTQARDQFKKGIEMSVDCANVTIQLHQTIKNIELLKEYKNNLDSEE